jgi:hypothetical protein
MPQGPIIIFDKSSLESLNLDEAVLLDNFYMSNITPLSSVECLSDLEKTIRSRSTPEQLVGSLAEGGARSGDGRGQDAHAHVAHCVYWEDSMALPPLGPFSPDDIAGFLVENGYTANPAGLIQHYQPDFTFERHSFAWLDINAIAVRKGNVVPDRPIRITFRCEYDGAFSRWKLYSVEELAPDVPSNALDRERNFPKISPWPPGGVE